MHRPLNKIQIKGIGTKLKLGTRLYRSIRQINRTITRPEPQGLTPLERADQAMTRIILFLKFVDMSSFAVWKGAKVTAKAAQFVGSQLKEMASDPKAAVTEHVRAIADFLDP